MKHLFNPIHVSWERRFTNQDAAIAKLFWKQRNQETLSCTYQISPSLHTRYFIP